eukprot:SAG11_NODE_455_length_9324_cov_2.103415_2_plen_322_part_00
MCALLQNYTVVGGKRSCRVALGADSNPMCHVHDTFRCVVLLDDDELAHAAPPFLNRFEKHSLNYIDILADHHHTMLHDLTQWMHDLFGSAIIDSKTFEPASVFMCYNDNRSLPSLVLLAMPLVHMERPSREAVALAFTTCQEKLAWTLTRDAFDKLAQSCNQNAIKFCDLYRSQSHSDLVAFASFVQSQNVPKSIVATHSDLAEGTQAAAQLKKSDSMAECVDINLAAFSSARALGLELASFLRDVRNANLFLHIDVAHGSINLPLTMLTIDQCLELKTDASTIAKHVCVILHLVPGDCGCTCLDFLSCWHYATVDCLLRK